MTTNDHTDTYVTGVYSTLLRRRSRFTTRATGTAAGSEAVPREDSADVVTWRS
ncbi:hypothetical protein [Amycolatopsis dongchuanensis]|uniref:hypothetical protein n=1 Tax=Amycolatopsis TaxID=1813 RepID=UPI0031F762C7